MCSQRTILDHLHRSFTDHADRLAVESWPDGRRLTYAQLDEATATLACHVRQAGVGPGVFVPIILPRCCEYLIAVVAVLRAGGVYAPIDPSAPRRDAMLEPLAAPIVIGREAGMLDPATARCGAGADDCPIHDVGPDAPAYVMYTSGTTGTPKGVVIPHRAVVRLVVDTHYASFGPHHRWGVMSAVAFDASTLEVWGALLNGGCCVVQSMPTPDLEDLHRYFAQASVTSTWLTASLFNAMVDEYPGAMAGLHQLVTGGERESVHHMRRFKQQCPGVELIHGYGPTENTTFSLCHTITGADLLHDRVPVGKPIDGSTMRIVPPGGGVEEPATPQRRGELLVGGAGLSLGYLDDEKRNAQKFVSDSRGTLWYRTGDLVEQRDDNTVIFVGRVDRQVKLRGHRIELDGVESALTQCAGVEQAATVITGDQADTRRMNAFFVPRMGASPQDVRRQLAERLPPSMIPDRFVAISSMPIGPTGKVDRDALLVQMKQEPTSTEQADNTLQARLIELFSARLGHALTPDDRFQDAGGHSLIAMRLSADVLREMQATLPAAEILRLQTIARMAEYLQHHAEHPGTVPGPPTDSAPRDYNDTSSSHIGHIRRRASFEHARDATRRAMIVHHAWHVRPAFSVEQLREAWLELLARHDALRTSVQFTESGPRLVEHDPRVSPVFFAEHAELGQPDPHDPSIRAVVARQRCVEDPPARMHVWSIADGSQLVLLAFHHAAIDEWSLDLVTDELGELLAGHAPCEAVPYAEFVRAEDAAQDYELAHELAKRIASGPATDIDLPPSGPQAGVNVDLDATSLTAEALDARARQLGVSPPALMACALSLALQQRYGPPARWIMTPFARRSSARLQRVVGCCLDMRLVEVTGTLLDEASRSVHEQMLECQRDRTLPLEWLIESVRRVAPDRASDATRFGLTYRHIDDRPRSIAGSIATIIDVEQPAARFGLCLHVERRSSGLRLWIEASRSHFGSEDLRSIGRSMLAIISGTSSFTEAPPQRAPAASLDNASAVSPRELRELGEIWQGMLGARPSHDSDFFLDGGSSLMAMQLSSAINKRLGRRLMLNQFLRNPTFLGLAQSIRADFEHPYARFSHRESPDASAPWAIALPGSSGRAVDYRKLWTTLGERAVDMLAFDLATIAVHESETFDRSRFLARFTALSHSYAIAHDVRGPITILGYSLGGLVAFDLAHRLAELGHRIDRIILLDAYAPAYLSRTPAWLLGKINARVRQFGRSGPCAHPRPTDHQARQNTADFREAEARRARWRAIHATLSKWSPPSTQAPVTLLRAASTWDNGRPLRHAHTNGLAPWIKGPLEVNVVDARHLTMLTTDVAQVADAIRHWLVDPTPTPQGPSSRPAPTAHQPCQP